MTLKFFVDHCVPRSVAVSLKDAGYEVMILKDFLPVDALDKTVIAKAQELDCILLSVNGDFADIVAYPPGSYGGIVALQIHNRPRNMLHVITRLKEYVQLHSTREHFYGKLFLVEAHRIRVRT